MNAFPENVLNRLFIIHWPDFSGHSSERLFLAPAAGQRTRDAGGLNVVGTYGYAWSSSSYAVDNSYVGFLRFLASEMTPLRGDGRALGFPVRCVQHLPAALPS